MDRRRDGNRCALRKLVQPARFLIAGENGEAWCSAARELAADAGVPLDAIRIGHLDGEIFDPRCTWLRYRGIADDGAVLVRHDRFVASRSPTASEEPQRALANVLGQILGRPVTAPVPAAV
jgi:2,4-dichlorophenol 6-monooxygenase